MVHKIKTLKKEIIDKFNGSNTYERWNLLNDLKHFIDKSIDIMADVFEKAHLPKIS